MLEILDRYRLVQSKKSFQMVLDQPDGVGNVELRLTMVAIVLSSEAAIDVLRRAFNSRNLPWR